jgi:hypothetical protein
MRFGESMTGMDELLAFLRARLDNDEQVTLKAVGRGSPVWTLQADGDTARIVEDDVAIIHRVDRLDAEHIVLWGPARALALIAALRGLVDGFSGEAGELRVLLTIGAALFAGHPDWRDEWLGGGPPAHIPTNERLDL